MENTPIQHITEAKLNRIFDFLEKEAQVPTQLRSEIIPQILNGTDSNGFFNETKHEYFLHGSNLGLGARFKVTPYSTWISNYADCSSAAYNIRMVACNILIKDILTGQ